MITQWCFQPAIGNDDGMTRIRRLLLALACIGALVLFPAAAGVATASDEPPAADAPPVAINSEADTDFLSLSPALVTVILGTLIPLINGVVTKANTSTKVKVLISLLLSAVAGLLTVAITPGGGAVISEQALLAAIGAFAVQAFTYLGLWKPLAVTSSNVTHVDANGQVVSEPGKLATVGVK